MFRLMKANRKDVALKLSLIVELLKGSHLSPYVYFEVSDQPVVQAADGVIQVRSMLKAQVEDHAEFATVPNVLAEALNLMKSEQVDMALEDDMLLVVDQRTTYKLITLKEVAKPKLFEVIPQLLVNVDTETFRKLLLPAERLATKGLEVLNNVLVEFYPDRVQCVGSDGFRLAIAKHEMQTSLQDKAQFLLPAKIARVLQAFMKNASELKFQLAADATAVLIGDTEIAFRAPFGKYPDYKQVLPKEFKTLLVLSKEEFSKALDKARTVVDKTSRGIVLSADTKFTIAVESEIGTAEETVEAQIQGEPITVAFNVEYLREPLRFIESDEIQLGFTDSTGIAKIAGVDDESYVYYVMPRR